MPLVARKCTGCGQTFPLKTHFYLAPWFKGSKVLGFTVGRDLFLYG